MFTEARDGGERGYPRHATAPVDQTVAMMHCRGQSSAAAGPGNTEEGVWHNAAGHTLH